MTVSESSDPLALVRERWQTMFPVPGKGVELSTWDAPVFIAALGIVGRFHLFDQETYQGTIAELLIVPRSRMHETATVLDTLAATLKGLAEKGLPPATGASLAALLGLDPVQFSEGMFTPDEATTRRRREALALMDGRFEAVAARMQEVYGLRLPRYLATFAAFFRSLDDLERQGVEYLGRSPNGIMVWFEDGGLARKTRDGLDPRLEGRYRCDPPELVTVMGGDSDGLHFGLWYDDPADLPTYMAHNYARDSAETWRDEEHTPLGVLTERAREQVEDPYEKEPAPLSVRAAQAALAWFAEADRAALAEHPPARRWLEAERIPTIGIMGPALPNGAGSIRVTDTQQRLEAWRNQPGRVQKWIASAKRDCAAGMPAAALTFGLDLHWLDHDTYRAEALELLVMAYEKLGRHAHAATVKVHHAHRDLPSVGVFLYACEVPDSEPDGGNSEAVTET